MTNPFVPNERTVAYFSMEIALEDQIPTYGGGLGVLAGDTIRSAADNRVPMVAVSLAHRKGYLYQRIDPTRGQIEEPVAWALEDQLIEEAPRAHIEIDGRSVAVRAWRYDVVGLGGFVVPVYLLDTYLDENSVWDRSITDVLYGGDTFYRLAQEAVLGIAGLRMLRALGIDRIERFHMNEGHASLLTFEALMELARAAGRETISRSDIESVRKKCVFTTHTPVAAGHDQFPLGLVKKVLERSDNLLELKDVFCLQFLSRILGDQPINPDDTFHGFRNEYVLNMTYLALNLSHFVNGVAKKHGEVSRHMFADYPIDAITNGVHVPTWASPPFQALFDAYIEGWRSDSFSLRYMINVPAQEVWRAHRQAKDRLLSYINKETNAGFDRETCTLGFARRFASYKRPNLLLFDVERLKRVCGSVGPIQIVYSGKAHPSDEVGKETLRTVLRTMEQLKGHVRVAFLPNYGMEMGKLLTSGCDVWINTPKRPLEASGTSGMKAAINGVPSLSVLDGWWIEGCIEGITGWGIGTRATTSLDAVSDTEDAKSLYDKLEGEVLPLYYGRREDFVSVMRNTIAFNGSFFNTQRMILQYVLKAYFS
jgi:glycogen phosphorylase